MSPSFAVSRLDYVPTVRDRKIPTQADADCKTIRNNSIAHKSKSADILYKAVYEIDADAIIALGLAVLKLSNSITSTGAKLGYQIADEFRKVGNQPNKIETHLEIKVDGS